MLPQPLRLARSPHSTLVCKFLIHNFCFRSEYGGAVRWGYEPGLRNEFRTGLPSPQPAFNNWKVEGILNPGRMASVSIAQLRRIARERGTKLIEWEYSEPSL